MKRLRVLAGAALLVCSGAAVSEATPLSIGYFSWVTTPDDTPTQTFAVDTFGIDPWPAGLSLTDVVVDFTTSSGSGQASFAFDSYLPSGGACVAQPVTLDQGGLSYQVAGYASAPPCDALAPLPGDITAATLTFAYNTLLGTVTVGSLGPALDREGFPTGEVQQILFEPATIPPTPVPEPGSMMLLASGLSWVYYRRRSARRS